MGNVVVHIDMTLFLESFELFERFLLPTINADRTASGFAIYSGQEAIDLYLDLFNEHKIKITNE